MFSNILKLSIILFFIMYCTKKKDKIFKKYFQPKFSELGIKKFEGKVIAFSNDACRKCAFEIIRNHNNIDSNTIIFYDSNIYGEKACSHLSCKVFSLKNDMFSRINIPNVIGHRIYYIMNNSIVKVKELNATNADSLNYFLN